MPKKFLLLILFSPLLFVLYFLFPKQTFAIGGPSGTSPLSGSSVISANENVAERSIGTFNRTVNSQLFGPMGGVANLGGDAFAGAFIPYSIGLGIIRGVTGQCAGLNSTEYAGCIKTYPQQANALGFFASATGALYDNRPASTVEYIAYVSRNAGFPNLVPPAYAQTGGIGFAGLQPILVLWQMVRNVAYLLFAVIFLVIGLMIILRVKIDPKTVVSIQNALPKIFLSLILITFSYPIAGLLIDLMYLSIGLILSIFTGLVPGFDISQFSQNLAKNTIFGFMGSGFFGATVVASGSAISDIINSLVGRGITGSIFGTVGGVIAGLIIAVAILYALFKTWLMLLGAYINIIIGVILSPLAMLGEAIPGVGGFRLWLMTMLTNLLQFPLVILLMLFGGSLVTMAKSNALAPAGASGPFVPPLIGGSDITSIPALAGLGILLMIPKAGEMLAQWLKSPPFKYGMAWQEAVTWAGRKGPIGAGTNLAIDTGSQRFGRYLQENYEDNTISQAIRNYLYRQKRYTPPTR